MSIRCDVDRLVMWDLPTLASADAVEQDVTPRVSKRNWVASHPADILLSPLYTVIKTWLNIPFQLKQTINKVARLPRTLLAA